MWDCNTKLIDSTEWLGKIFRNHVDKFLSLVYTVFEKNKFRKLIKFNSSCCYLKNIKINTAVYIYLLISF